MSLLYFFIIKIYVFLIYIVAALGNTKAKLWVGGRRNSFSNLKQKLGRNERRIWIHASSLGEFEQGRPIIEAIRSGDPDLKIVLTFFSPSGYEVRKNYPDADYICYLPMDGPVNSPRFIDLIHPEKVIFIKYEFWYFYLRSLKKRDIPVFLCSAIFRKDQLFFKWYGGWYRNMLSYFKQFFVQNEESGKLLENIGFTNVIVSGDTRFDRVSDIAAKAADLEKIRIFVNGTPCLIAGSTWMDDELLLARYVNETSFNLKVVLAPHEIHKSHIEAIKKLFVGKVICYSEADAKTIDNFDVLIIDNIGMLSSLYRYGNVAYIGGGFGKGIHNILEAATYGLPILFGPRYEKFQEAVSLAECGGAFPIQDYDELKSRLEDLFSHSALLAQSGKKSLEYVRKNLGATRKILTVVFEK